MDCLNAAQMYTRTLEQGFTFDISLSLAPGVVSSNGRHYGAFFLSLKRT